MKTHRGGCHCGAVSFEVDAPADVTVDRCNCSICRMCGYLHLIVPASRFRLLKGQENLALYQFNSGVAQHFFCRTCGIKSFYVPRSNPDGYSVNFNCVDPSGFGEVTFEDFDGQNWEANAHKVAHRSKE